MPRLRTSDSVNRGHFLNRGRIAWWLTVPWLAGGGKIFDLVSGGNASFVGGVGWQPTARPGGAGQLGLDGSSGGASAGTVIATNAPLAGVTIAGWVNINSYTTNASILNKNHSFILRTNNGYSQFQVWAGGVAHYTTGLRVLPSTWNRIVGTFDGSTASVWVNGVFSVSASFAGATGGTTDAVALGYSPVASEYLPGAIDDVSIWNRALSAAEVYADYESGRRGYPIASEILNYAIDETTDVINTPTPATFPRLEDGAMSGGFQTLGY